MSIQLRGLKHGRDWCGPSANTELKQCIPKPMRLYSRRRTISSSSSSTSRARDRVPERGQHPVKRTTPSGHRENPKVLDRDFFLSVLNSTATKRDAKSYISKFKPPKNGISSPKTPAVKPVQRVPDTAYYDPIRVHRPGVNLGSFYAPIRAVDLNPVFAHHPLPDLPPSSGDNPLHIALVKIRAPQKLDEETLKGVGLTLSQLTRLGLSCAVVVDSRGHEKPESPDENAYEQRRFVLEQADRVVAALGTSPGPGVRRLDNIFSIPNGSQTGGAGPSSTAVTVAFRKHLLAPIKRGIIPVIAPIGYTTKDQIAMKVSPDDAVLALTREFAGIGTPPQQAEDDPVTMAQRIKTLQREVSLDKIILLDPLGGIPSSDRADGSHVFINMEQEYDEIKTELTANGPSPTTEVHLRNLTLLRNALALLPPTSSAISTTPEEAANSGRSDTSSTTPEVGTRRQKNPLIHNLLTDKPIFSSSLPAGRLKPTPFPSHSLSPSSSPILDLPTPTTSIKRGIPLTFLPDPRLTPWLPPSPTQHPSTPPLTLNSPLIDLPRLTHLLSSSFSRPLNTPHYLARINPIFAGLIIAGHYEGCALFTWETPPGSPPGTPPVPYLDKFAVLRESQGGGKGVADILFTAMVRTALPAGVVWRSRRENVVNKWYFERARGTWELPGGRWTMFWTTEGIERDCSLWRDYTAVCEGVVPSWADGGVE